MLRVQADGFANCTIRGNVYEKAHRNRETGLQLVLIKRLRLPYFMRVAILVIGHVACRQDTCLLPQITQTPRKAFIDS